MLRRPARRPAAYQQALAAALSMYVGGAVTGEDDPVFYVGFAVVLLVLGLTHPARARLLRPGPGGISPLLVTLALVMAAPLALYAVRVSRIEDTSGVFYTGIAATALTIPFVALAAGMRADGYRLPLWVTGITLVVLSGASLAAPDAISAMPAWGAALGVLAGAVFVLAGEWEARRLAAVEVIPAGARAAH